jgi:hypothetical protein
MGAHTDKMAVQVMTGGTVNLEFNLEPETRRGPGVLDVGVHKLLTLVEAKKWEDPAEKSYLILLIWKQKHTTDRKAFFLGHQVQ